jgi:DNA-binding response OmpR family regulator
MSERILIVEDEEKMARMVELELTHEGYGVVKCSDGLSGLQTAEQGNFDLILLDIMLPALSGIEVLRRLRKTKSTPVILLTARDEVVDKVLGLDSGADDYITKPFAIEELLARIRAALRKSASEKPAGDDDEPSGTRLTAGKLILDAGRHLVAYDGEPVELTLKEFELLRCLLENKGMVLTRDALLDKVWGYDYIGETNAVDVYVRFLRSKIDEKYGVKLISTVRGVGYRIEVTTQR